MLALSQTTGYAILALSCLEGRMDGWVLAKDIAACTGIPLPYLSKILHDLGETNLIEAKRGYRGGFRLKRSARTITLMEVAEAVEGKEWMPRCLLGLHACSDERACPSHSFWCEQRKRIESHLRETTLRDVAVFERQRGQRLNPGACQPTPHSSFDTHTAPRPEP